MCSATWSITVLAIWNYFLKLRLDFPSLTVFDKNKMGGEAGGEPGVEGRLGVAGSQLQYWK